MTLDAVLARVAARYARLGMPSWADPHPGGVAARDEEYSRLTDPGRYGIVHARGRAWADSLGELPGVGVTHLDPAREERFDRGVRITSPRPGTLPLLLLERDPRGTGRDASPAVLHISVVRPQEAVQALPDCGCDACDRGSEDLLEAIDLAVGPVVGGPFVLLRGDGWHAQWHPGGGSSGGTAAPDHHRVMDLCERLAGGEPVRLPARTEASVGRSWLD